MEITFLQITNSMEGRNLEKRNVYHSTDGNSEKAPTNTSLKSDEKMINYGSMNEKDPLLEPNDVKETKRLGICVYLRSLTIEPIMFVYSFAYILNYSCLSNMMMKKGCLYHFNYSTSVCSNLSNFPSQKEKVEILANNYYMYFSLMDLIGGALMIFIAPWSDKYGRKLPLLLALIGTSLSDLLLALNTYDFQTGLIFVVLTTIPQEIVGGYICILTIFYSHASEVSSERMRTVKYTVLEIAFSVGVALGGLTGGWIYRYYGYFYIYATSFVLHAMCLPLLMFSIEETTGLDSTATWKEKIGDLFVCESLLKGWKAVVRPRENHGRALILLCFASMCVCAMTYESLGSVSYIFLHNIYNWGPTMYNTVKTVLGLSTMMVLGIAILVLAKIFKVSDPALGITGVCSMMVKYTIFAFAYFGEYLYFIGYAIGMLNGLTTLAIRSCISKNVDKNELGKVFSFLATCESVVPMLGTVIITKVFNATINIYPNMSFLTVAGLLIIPLGSFSWAYICMKRVR